MSAREAGAETGTEIVDPMVRIRVLGSCVWLRERQEEETRDAAAGVVHIRTGQPAIAGCWPVAVLLHVLYEDAPREHIDLAAAELVKLGHVVREWDSLQVTEAGYSWFRSRYPHRAVENLSSSSPLGEQET